MLTLNILCNNPAKNLRVEIRENENLHDLKRRLGYEYQQGKWIYAGKLLDENEELRAIIKEENPNIHLFAPETEVKMASNSLSVKPSERLSFVENNGQDPNENREEMAEPQSEKREMESHFIEPNLIDLPKYSIHPFPTKILIINGQKYKVETGDPIPIPDGVDIQEIRRRMFNSGMLLQLSSRNLIGDANEENIAPNQQPMIGNLNNNFRIYRAINIQINLNQWADIFGQILKLLIACYFVTRYLSFPRAVIACTVFAMFFLHGIGLFQFLNRRFFPNQPAAPLPVVNHNPAPAPQPDLRNEQPILLNGQDQNVVPAAPQPPQAPQTLLSIVQAAIIGFFVSMFPQNIPQGIPDEPDNAL